MKFRAETTIWAGKERIDLSNRILIDKMIANGIALDNRLVNNPAFQYNLFTLFDKFTVADITDIKIIDGVIKISTRFDSYEITTNSDGGLTLISEVVNGGEEIQLVNSKLVEEILPTDEGMMIVKQNVSAVTDIAIFRIDIDSTLSVKEINKAGIETKRTFIRHALPTPENIFQYRADINSLTATEYRKLLDLYLKKYEKGNIKSGEMLIERVRDPKDFLSTKETTYTKKNKNIRRQYLYISADVMGLAGLTHYSNDKTIDKRDLKLLLAPYSLNKVDPSVANLVEGISKYSGANVGISSKEITEYQEEELISGLLSTERGLVYR